MLLLKLLTASKIWCYFEVALATPYMNYRQFFESLHLTEDDVINLAVPIKLLHDELGMGTCWCVKKYNHPVFEQFRLTNRSRPLFKGMDARMLAVAFDNRFPPLEEGRYTVLVRRHTLSLIHI